MHHNKDKAPQDKLTYFEFIDNTGYNIIISIYLQLFSNFSAGIVHRIRVQLLNDALSIW